MSISKTAPAVAPCAPVTGWRRMLGDTLRVGGATAVGHVLGAVTSLLLRMFLDPAQMGVWQGLKLYLSYGNYANLGISKAAARELTLARGEGDLQRAQPALDLAFTVNTAASIMYAGVLLAAAAWVAGRGAGPLSQAWAAGLVVVAALAVLQRYVTFQVTLLRSRQQFGATSRLAVAESVLTLGVAATATWLWGLPGLYAGTACVLAASLAMLWRGRTRLGWAWDRREALRLWAIGAPILAAGVASSLFRSLDRLMVLIYLDDGEFQLGCYSVTLMVCVQLYGLANMLAGVMGPRYGELYGRTGERAEVARLAARASELQAAFLALPAGLALAAAPPLLSWLLPAYRSGLAPLGWLVPGTMALGLALPASGYLVAVGRGRALLAALLASLAAAAVGNHLALSRGAGLEGVALATCLADFLYLLLVVALSIWPQLTGSQRLRYVGALLLAAAPSIALAQFCFHSYTVAAEPVAAIVPSACVLAVWAATLAVGWRRGGWRELWRQSRR